MIESWSAITLKALQNLWQGFLNFVPMIIGAIIIFVIGWFIAIAVGKLVTEILKKIKFNQIFEKGNWDEALAKADIKVDASEFIGAIVKWILVIVFLLVAVDILGLDQFAYFLQRVLDYLPHVLVAALIFVVTVIVADIVDKVVRATVEKIKIGYGQVISVVVKWAIWIFAILMILQELVIVPYLVNTLFNALIFGFVGILVISLGLAFGLGGREAAAKLIDDLRQKISQK